MQEIEKPLLAGYEGKKFNVPTNIYVISFFAVITFSALFFIFPLANENEQTIITVLDFTFAIWNKISIKHLTVDIFFMPI